jgi:hypothetical protein
MYGPPVLGIRLTKLDMVKATRMDPIPAISQPLNPRSPYGASIVGIIKIPDPTAQPTAIDQPRQKPITLP